MSLSNFYAHPRDYLLLELEKRQSRNRSYSLRAFARDLEVAPSTLSEVIKGQYGLSESTAGRVATTMGLAPDQAQHFIDLFRQKFAKKGVVRRGASRSAHHRRNRAYQSLPLDEFRLVADWFHMALLEWITVQGKKVRADAKTAGKAAAALGIEVSVAQEAFQLLARVGQLELVKNEWRLREDFTATNGDVPSEAVRSFHKQIVAKAALAIEDQAIDEREISSTIVSFRKSQMKEAKQALRDFRREFAERFGGAEGPDAVYCLGLQFFALAAGESDDET